VTIAGVQYGNTGTVLDTVPGKNGSCDTIVTYHLEKLPQPTRTENITFCPGHTVTIAGVTYNAPGTVVNTVTGKNGACDTIVTYHLERLPQPARTESVSFCQGYPVTIGGTTFSASGATTQLHAGKNGACDTLVTYVVTMIPYPTRIEVIRFCPSQPVVIAGVSYHIPGTVIDTVPGKNGACDTIVSYILKSNTPAPSTITVHCPPSVQVQTVDGNPTQTATFGQPTASTNCPCPGIALTQTEGLPSGSAFPVGVNAICFTARDSCGQTASCCMNVTVSESSPCDIKVIGCIKYELLTITQDAASNKTYRIRVTNSCSDEMVYVAFQLPTGLTAVKPHNNEIYTSPDGRNYQVANPNYSPFYSTRFMSQSTGIAAGQSDIFKYTLPPLASVNYIHVIAKVSLYAYYEAYLNTFYCPVGVTPSGQKPAAGTGSLHVFPNPTHGNLSADLSAWEGQTVRLAVFDSRGQQVLETTTTADFDPQEVHLPAKLAPGLYFLRVMTGDGMVEAVRFIVE
jgi:hypothetical protein